MAHYRCALIGCGGMSALHAAGYASHKNCEIVAVADTAEDKARARAASHAPGAAIYTDYVRMLKAEKPDIVSICLWPHLHAPAVLAGARAGVKAIHCEKPMAPTWGESLKMVAACDKAGVQLTFGHQRRFLDAFRKARQLKEEGAIGELVRVEGSCDNMIDWGTHWLDMMFFMNNETPALWVLGQISAPRWREVFGLPIETQAICELKFQNNVRGVLFTGEDNDIGCSIRLIGSAGCIELRGGEKPLWVQGKGGGWRTPKVVGSLHSGEAVGWGVHDLVDSLRAGRQPELSARRALQATEVIFATYESSRRRGRVDLPLKPKDSAYLSMIENGDLKPKRK
ncbi:MAG: Gfo/Idh/MocA family oxidoreductase [Candidatus Handelsmanbacteria bacterium]|nr:Gfo/Idh/MocA family oxidoreductase [Candidatus Handelsmanbacteria bacterium]